MRDPGAATCPGLLLSGSRSAQLILRRVMDALLRREEAPSWRDRCPSRPPWVERRALARPWRTCTGDLVTTRGPARVACDNERGDGQLSLRIAC